MAARLTNEQRRYAVKELTLGSTYTEIQAKFHKKFNRGVNKITIARIRKQNLASITDARGVIAADGAVNAAALKQKAHQLIERRLDQALADDSEIEKLRKQYQSGEITEAGFKLKLELYERLTINELTKVSEAMHAQSKGEKDDPITPADQAALAAILTGIQAGNPVQLVQILNGRTVGSPAA